MKKRKSSSTNRKKSLRGQKVKKSGRRRRPLALLFWCIPIFLIVGLLSLPGSTDGAPKTKKWQIIISPTLVPVDKINLRKKITNLLANDFRYGYRKKAQTTLRKVAALAKADQVNIFQVEEDKLAVFGVKATPVFALDNSKGWGVSGALNLFYFGDRLKNHPRLIGIVKKSLGNSSRIEFKQLGPKTRDIVKDAIALASALSKKQISFHSLSYLKYRGFELELSNKTKVVVGFHPFESKLDRMSQIMAKLGNRIAKRIEVDFDNKAFIKE